MGLASYGDPHARIPGQEATYYEVFERIIEADGDLGYRIGREWIAYDRVRDTWLSDTFFALFGPRRMPGAPIKDHHRHIAAALQLRLEVIVLGHLRYLRRTYGIDRLCIAGGVGLNCSLNGRIERSGIFSEIFVQPASGDDGSTLGVCYLAARRAGWDIAPQRRHDFYLGAHFSEEEMRDAIARAGMPCKRPSDLFRETAHLLAEGKIVAWFQGRAEFGPRALGNRSILCRPYPAAMRDHVNDRVKFRESFRPFAPAVLADAAREFFAIAQESPHMLIAASVRTERANEIPAVVHVDGTCRVQTVSHVNNPTFRSLLEAFAERTGIPILLNTSFNVKGQPIVNTPDEAIACWAGTNIDCLVLGAYLLQKEGGCA